MMHIHIHLLPWHWFWRNHSADSGVVIVWRGPIVIVWMDDTWPDTSTVQNVQAYRRNTLKAMLIKYAQAARGLRFHP